MTTMTLSSKGQITLPVSLRRSLGLKPGDKVAVANLGGKAVLEKASSGDIFSLVGRFRKHGAKPMPKDAQEAMVSKAAYDHYMRKVREGRA
jgi:AbrB family looped-hinge helix DNA binding protein